MMAYSIIELTPKPAYRYQFFITEKLVHRRWIFRVARSTFCSTVSNSLKENRRNREKTGDFEKQHSIAFPPHPQIYPNFL